MNTSSITLDTPLAAIEWDDADRIGEDLIDTSIAGDDWGLAWSRVVRSGGTVRDLRDDLYGHAAEPSGTTAQMTLNDLIVLSDPVEINRALRDGLAGRDPQTIATIEINGGDIATIVDDQNTPQTVAQVLAEIDAFLTGEDEL